MKKYNIVDISWEDFEKYNQVGYIYCIIPDRFERPKRIVLLKEFKDTDAAAKAIKRYIIKNYSFGIGINKILRIQGMGCWLAKGNFLLNNTLFTVKG